MQSIDPYIIYLRKSRSDSPDMSVEEVLAKHEEQLQEYARREFGQPIPENHIFREVVSGETIADRPVMIRVMRLLETGSIAGVLVIEPQRLSRGDLEDCGRIVNTFRYTNTLIMTPPKTYDLSNEYDRKFFEMELTRGNDYLEYTKKILNRGRIASIKRGNFIGSVPPYGYKKVTVKEGSATSHTLAIVPEEADAVRLMYHLFVDHGYGFTKIARHLDKLGIAPRIAEHWSPAALKDMLENPVYIGKIRWGWRTVERRIVNGEIVKQRPKKEEDRWIYVDGKHEPIINEDIFQAALERRGKNVCIRKDREIKNPFAGLLFCATCGRAMSYKRSVNKGKRTSICESMLCNNQAICHTKSVKYMDFFDRICDTLENTITNFEIELKRADNNVDQLHKQMIKHLELDLCKLRQKDHRQKDAFDDGIYTKEEYLSRNAKTQEQISEKEKALEQALRSALPSVNYQERITQLTDCLNILRDPEATPQDKNTFLKSCIDRIEYSNKGESRPGIGRYVNNQFELQVYLKL